MKLWRSGFASLLLSVCVCNGQTGNFSVLHTFAGSDGEYPSILSQGKSGNLYGTTFSGGDLNDRFCDGYGCGVVFKIAPESDSFNVVYEFLGQSGDLTPATGVIPGPDGALYGVTELGGVLFRISPTGAEKVLYAFENSLAGDEPTTALTGDAAGNLYGMTASGGPYLNNGGVICKYDRNGVYSVLFSLEEPDGHEPFSALTLDSLGNLFGTMTGGGTSYGGVVFELDPSGVYTVLHSFSGSDGSDPESPLIRDQHGDLYGSTALGGSFNSGVVFELDPEGAYTVLYNFTGGTDGGSPNGPLVRDQLTGTVYGTAGAGGTEDAGVIFSVDSAGNESVLYSFTGLFDGKYPQGSVTRRLDSGLREFFGTTYLGGGAGCVGNPTYGCGTVFRFTLK